MKENELIQRVNDLEIKFSYQEELLNELNMIVAKQGRVIDDLLIAIKSLKDQGASSSSASAVDEKPPHY